MQEILESLKQKPVLKHTDVLRIKEYIGKKHAQSDNRAAILANTIHRIIDSQLPGFTDNSRTQIRIDLLKQAISKNHYTIHADNIFQACLVNSNNEETYINTLTEWLNQQQDTPVTPGTLTNFIKTMHGQSDVLPLPAFWGKIPVNNLSLAIASLILLLTIMSVTLYNALSPIGVLTLTPIFGSTMKPIVSSSMKPVGDSALTSGNAVTKQASPYQGIPNQLPTYLKYRPINETGLRDFLTRKNSLLAEHPYFPAILQAAEDFNVNPLLLFAIAGHEQSFVAKTQKDARKIANNPFNVYHSWQAYNTDIHDSSRIVARTVINSSKGRPENVDPFVWISNQYAEDKNWWKGVRRIFELLEKEVGEK